MISRLKFILLLNTLARKNERGIHPFLTATSEQEYELLYDDARGVNGTYTAAYSRNAIEFGTINLKDMGFFLIVTLFVLNWHKIRNFVLSLRMAFNIWFRELLTLSKNFLTVVANITS